MQAGNSVVRSVGIAESGPLSVTSPTISYASIPHQRREIVLGGRLAENGIRLVGWGTDRRTIGIHGGVQYRSTRPGNGWLVFDLEDGFRNRTASLSSSPTYCVEVEYLDRGHDQFTVTSPVRQQVSAVIKSNTNTWKRVSVHLPLSALNNEMAPGGDFRIQDDGDGAEYIRRVSVTNRQPTEVRGRLRVNFRADGLGFLESVEVRATDDENRLMANLKGHPVLASVGGTSHTLVPIALVPFADGISTTRLPAGLISGDQLPSLYAYWDGDPLLSSSPDTKTTNPRKAQEPWSRLFWEFYRVHCTLTILVGCIAWVAFTTPNLINRIRRIGRMPLRTIYPAGFFILAATVMTYPRLFKAHDGLADLGDPLLNSWILNHGSYWLLRDWRFFFDGFIFYGNEGTLALSEHLFGLVLFSWPIVLITGNPVLTHSLLEWLSFALGAWSAYGLALYLFERRGPAVFAGCVFAFTSFRFNQMGHIQTISTALVPLIFYYLIRMVREPSGRWASRLSLVTLLQGLVSGYMTVFLLYCGLAFLGGYLMLSWRVLRNRSVIILGVVSGAIVALGSMPFLQPYVHYGNQYGISRSYQEVQRFAPGLNDYLNTPQSNIIYGAKTYVYHINKDAEASLFPGLCVFALLWLGLIVSVGWLRKEYLSSRKVMASLGMASLVLGVLTYGVLRIGADSQLRGPSPWSPFSPVDLICLGLMPLLALSIQMLSSITGGGISSAAIERNRPVMVGFVLLFGFSLVFSFGPQIRGFSGSVRNLLFEIMYGYAPGISGMRVPQRVWIVGSVATAMLCGLAVSVLTGGMGRTGRWVVGVGFVGVFLAEHFCAPLQYNLTGPTPGAQRNPRPGVIEIGKGSNPLYDWVKNNAQIDAVVELPNPNPFYDLRYVFNITQHTKRLLNGSSGTSPADYENLRATLRQFPDPASLRLLREKRVGFVVFHRGLMDEASLAEFDGRLAIHGEEVRLSHTQGDSRVYQLVPKHDDVASGPRK